MASANCWRCLSHSRPSTQFVLPRASIAATANFSTTSIALKTPPKPGSGKKTLAAVRRPGEQTTFKRKKKAAPAKTGKPPAPGERKAMRKRVVLSNTNALEVVGMKDFDGPMLEKMLLPEFGEDGVREKILGNVVGLEGKTVDSLRAVEAFTPAQGWGLFKRPGLLVREESVLLSRKIVQAEKEKSVLKLVIDGEKGTGKSLMLIHAMATGFLRNWVVMNIPEAQEVVNAVTDYSPIQGTSPTLYAQNAYIASMLGQIGKANAAVLTTLETTQPLENLPVPISTKTVTLARLCELGARDPDIAWPLFEAFWTEITLPGRPPLLFTLDSLSLIMQNSQYKSNKFEPIHAMDLAIVKKFTDLLSGATTLPNGGAVIAATSRSHAVLSKSLTLAIAQEEDRKAGRETTKLDPFERGYDARAEKTMKGVEVLKLKGLSKSEARGLMEYWAQSGVFRGVVDERVVAEKWALAGNGVVGEIERGALRMRI